MRHGSIARRTTAAGTGTPAFEMIADNPTGCRLMQMQITLAAATASTYGLGRPAAKGVGPTTPVAVLDMLSANANVFLTKTALAWTTTAPTSPSEFFRRVSFPNVITSQILWIFEHGLYIPPGGTLVLWNLAINGVVDVSIDVEEYI